MIYHILILTELPDLKPWPKIRTARPRICGYTVVLSKEEGPGDGRTFRANDMWVT